MTDWLNRTHLGDCRDLMRQMIADGVHVQCVVCSPPYWGLRDYGVAGAIGLEKSLQEWVSTIADVFDLVAKVLAPDGVLWLNLGDAYANDGKWGGETGGKQAYLGEADRKRVGREKRRTGLAPKNLMGQPWRVAFALQDRGWCLRSDIVWWKPNPMPETVIDRPTKSHEYVFLMSRASRYYYNFEAIAEPASLESHARAARGRSDSHKHADGGPGNQTIAKGSPVAGRVPGVNPKATRRTTTPVAGWDTGGGGHSTKDHARSKQGLRDSTKFGRGKGWRNKQNTSFKAAIVDPVLIRNARSVWKIPTEGFSGAHFATFPQALVARCILAGSRPGDTIFDPFMGSGTVAQVATNLARNFIGCELSAEYLKLHDLRRTTQGMAF